MVATCYSLLKHYYLLRYCEYNWQLWFPLGYALNMLTAVNVSYLCVLYRCLEEPRGLIHWSYAVKVKLVQSNSL